MVAPKMVDITNTIDVPPGLEQVPRISDLDQVVELQRRVGPLFLRFSLGPVADGASSNRDRESGCYLPGLVATPLTPESWWDRPEQLWIARQLCQHTHRWVRPHNVGWLLTGDIVGRGPDSEPLIARPVPVGLVTPGCVEIAASAYERAFTSHHL